MVKLKQKEAEKLAKLLNYKHNGLVVAVVQDAETSDVLMTAFMDPQAVKMTLTTGLAHYWSLERGKLWLKGETSGHHQHVKEIRVDCDNDTLLLKVKQDVGACHLGYRTCFFRKVKQAKFKRILPQIFKPEKVYRRKTR